MKIARALDSALNLTTFALAVVVVTGVADRYVHRADRGAPGPQGPKLESQFALDGVDWANYSATLVLALSTDCRYCRESEGFYRQISQSRRMYPMRIVAALPEPAETSRAYLQSRGLRFDDVRQVDLKRLEIQGTPTLIVVDRFGRVQSTWVGLLSPAREMALTKELGLLPLSSTLPRQPSPPARGANDPETISAAQLHDLLLTNKVLPIVDIRPREDYRAEHVAGSLNIPYDEVEYRLPHEVPKWPVVVIYCHYCPSCSDEQAVASFCALNERILSNLGYLHLKFLSEGVPQLKQAGVKVVEGAGKSPATGTKGPC